MTPGANGGVNGTKVLGEDPVTGLEVSLRGGRFGPYLQLGEQKKPEKKGDTVEKPKRAGLPKGLAPDDVDLEKALALLALPREVGIHPEDNEPIIAGVGRFGPYVKHGKTYANLEEGDDVLNVGLNRAVTLIAEKKANPGKGRRFGADPGKVLGEHPDKGGPIVVKKGRYGPYVSPRRRQRHAHRRPDAGDRDARAGGRPVGSAHRQGRRQEAGQEESRQESDTKPKTKPSPRAKPKRSPPRRPSQHAQAAPRGRPQERRRHGGEASPPPSPRRPPPPRPSPRARPRRRSNLRHQQSIPRSFPRKRESSVWSPLSRGRAEMDCAGS